MIQDTLLISCPGDTGGLFIANGKASARLTYRPTTGLFVGEDELLFSYQDRGGKSIRAYRDGRAFEWDISTTPMDLHDLKILDGHLYAVNTEDNNIVRLDTYFKSLKTWPLPWETEKDSAHLNSVTLYRNRLLGSVFGRFTRHRQYKEGTAGLGEVVDLETGETFISGLSQPHSLTVHDGLLYLCSSEDSELRIYDGNQLQKKIRLPGYTRGLAITEDTIYVGMSASRNSESASSGLGTATIAIIDRETFSHSNSLGIGCREIYDIRVMNDAAWMIPHAMDNSTEEKILKLEHDLEAYKSGYEAYQNGYAHYQTGYERLKIGYEHYKARYEVLHESVKNDKTLKNTRKSSIHRRRSKP